MVDGYRESAQSWKELLLDLKRRGLETGPELAVGDGALGFWKALREVYGETRVQRCWVHKRDNSPTCSTRCPNPCRPKPRAICTTSGWPRLGPTPKPPSTSSSQPTAQNTTRPQSASVKDRERLLSFYDFPAEHWKHIRTTNPIESTFATVRLRTVKTKGCLSRKTALRHGLQT